MNELYGLHTGFLRSADRHPQRPALDVQGESLTYSQLRVQAEAVATTLGARLGSASARRVGVFGSRSVSVYSGSLGTLMAGCAVVPLNPGFPAERTLQMINLAGLDALIVDADGQTKLDPLLARIGAPLLIIVGSVEAASDLGGRWPQCRFATPGGAVGRWRGDSRRRPRLPGLSVLYVRQHGRAERRRSAASQRRALRRDVARALSSRRYR